MSNTFTDQDQTNITVLAGLPAESLDAVAGILASKIMADSVDAPINAKDFGDLQLVAAAMNQQRSMPKSSYRQGDYRDGVEVYYGSTFATIVGDEAYGLATIQRKDGRTKLVNVSQLRLVTDADRARNAAYAGTSGTV